MGALDRDYWREPSPPHKRLKGIDEPTNKRIADTKKLDKIIQKNTRKSDRYKHNQKILEANRIVSKQEPLYIKLLRELSKIFMMIGKAFMYILFATIVIIVIMIITSVILKK